MLKGVFHPPKRVDFVEESTLTGAFFTVDLKRLVCIFASGENQCPARSSPRGNLPPAGCILSFESLHPCNSKGKGIRRMPFPLWWSVRNHRRTLRQIRALRVKVVIHLVQHDVIDLNGLSAAVEDQSELVIIEIDFIQEDVDDGTAVKRIIEAALLKHGEKVCDFLR